MSRRNLRTLKRKKEKKRYRLIAALVLLPLLMGLAGYSLVRYYIPVNEMIFAGNRHLKNDELIALLKTKKGAPLFGVSGRDLYRRLRTSPWVKDAVVKRDLSGRIVINLTEAVPVAILSMSDKPYLIDKDGVVLEQMKEGTLLLLPVIKDIDPGSNKNTYAEAVKFVKILHDKRVLSSGGNIEITGQRPDDITLQIDNISVKIGAGDLDKKLERLEFVKNEIEKRNMSVGYIDLRFANKIIVRPVSQQVSGSDKDAAPAVQDKAKTEKKKREGHGKGKKKKK